MKKNNFADFVLFATMLAAASCVAEPELRKGEVESPTAAAGAGEPGSHLGNYTLTYYWVTNQADYGGSNNTAIKTASCSTIATVPSAFASALKLEGTGKLTDGRIVNYHKSCGCSSYGCYVVAGDDYPWGIGVQSRPLDPMRSIAVDKNYIAYGDWVYAPELDGYTVAAGPWGAFVHDGCLKAVDTGSAIKNTHIDFFVGYKSAYLTMVGDLGAKTQLYRGGSKCTDATVSDGAAEDEDDPPEDDGGDDAGEPPEDLSSKACFPGSDGGGNTCLDVGALPPGTSGYAYPSPLGGMDNYRKPLAYLDLASVNANTKLAPNFTLGELAQQSKGRYAIVQPHAVIALQKFRDALGGIKVNSGFRSPSYNGGVGGATHSRHMFGDAFDIKGVSASLTSLENACTGNGGTLVEYNNHVHCDFRNIPVDPIFFGIAAGAPPAAEPQFGAQLEEDEGRWTAVDFEGFDEGEPAVRWEALDAAGNVLQSHRGPDFAPPPGTTTVRALVGAQLEMDADLAFTSG